MMGGYQQLVRGEAVSCEFRNGLQAGADDTWASRPRSVLNCRTSYHSFRTGHKLMVQVSEAVGFPLVDRNPQKFMEIPKATTAISKKRPSAFIARAIWRHLSP